MAKKSYTIEFRFYIHTQQLVLGLTAFFLSKFQIGVMKWCLLELFNKIIGA
ncbi:hypothetical protein CLOSS21_02838 [Clostridium sp. SS2/1]|nr:hypothetical protein CLOSS21_02838 [Clostridium sp. SS2/1]